MSNHSPDENTLKKQAELIHALHRYLPAPILGEDASDESEALVPVPSPDRTQSYWTELSRRSGDSQIITSPEGVLDLLSSTIALRAPALVGGPSYAEASMSSYNDTLNGYELSVEWSNSLIRIYWNTESIGPPPDILCIEDQSGKLVMAVAIPGLASGTLVLDEQALRANPQFSPSESKWYVTLRSVRT